MHLNDESHNTQTSMALGVKTCEYLHGAVYTRMHTMLKVYRTFAQCQYSGFVVVNINSKH